MSQRPVTIERTSKWIKAWIVWSNGGMIAAVYFAWHYVITLNNPKVGADWMMFGIIAGISRIMAASARWWENG